jgi:DNA-binding Lrp family transcriptional regulator
MAHRREATERQISEYIKQQAQDNSVFQRPISKIAEDTQCSTSTVWRVIQKLQDKRVIKVIKSRAATEPDTIYYLGEQNDTSLLIEQINGHISSISILIGELAKQAQYQQDAIDTLRYENETYRAQKEKILKTIEE